MVLRSVILGITLLLLVMKETGTSEALNVSMSLPDCKEYCGGIRIPYPFGIGSNCARNEWFDVVCNKSSAANATERAFIRSINAELLRVPDDYQLSEDTVFEVKGPIISSNCPAGRGGSSGSSSLNLTGSPFTFSDENAFVAVGCNTRAEMTRIHPEIVGCESTCSTGNNNANDDRQYGSSFCNGTNCCHTTIPSYLQVFDAKIEKLNSGTSSGDHECKLAFLANQTWLQQLYFSNVTDPISFLQTVDYVPVVLNRFIYLPPYITRSTDCHNHTISENWNISHCVCGSGFEGNPYLPNGCQDIDECARDPNWCGRGQTCVNTIGSYHCKQGKSWIIILGIGLGFGVFFALIGIWRLYKCIKKRKEIRLKKKFFKRNGGLLLQQQLSSNDQGNIDHMRVFSSKELEKATDNFNDNRILGQGGQGTVYKGMLVDGRIVAVKKSKLVDEAKLEEFINEVVILSQINHRNVVKILGCCLETEVPLLVYEFIPNGNLFQYLHGQEGECPMSWEMRLRIATEVAGALSYLHFAAAIPIYHRDIKSTNILLDDKYRAKVSDFGTSRSISIDQTHLTTNVQGTFGYFDPEYFQSSQFTNKSDVYSFGVVLVELLTGQKPISFTRSEYCRSLVTHFILSMEENRLFEILDPHVKQDYDKEEALAFANLAKRCLNLNGKNRPTMKEVARELERITCLSQKDSNVETNHEEIQFMDFGISNSWEFTSSTSSGFQSTSVFPLEVEPLISDTACRSVSLKMPTSKETSKAKSKREISTRIYRCLSQ